MAERRMGMTWITEILFSKGVHSLPRKCEGLEDTGPCILLGIVFLCLLLQCLSYWLILLLNLLTKDQWNYCEPHSGQGAGLPASPVKKLTSTSFPSPGRHFSASGFFYLGVLSGFWVPYSSQWSVLLWFTLFLSLCVHSVDIVFHSSAWAHRRSNSLKISQD